MSREKELAAILRGVSDNRTRAVNEEIAALLDELDGIKTAALPENLQRITREHAAVAKHYETQGLSGGEANEAHRHRGVLLEVARLYKLLTDGLKRQRDAATSSRRS